MLTAALAMAREVCVAESAFAAVRDDAGAFPLDVRLGLTEPGWPQVTIRTGRGIGGQVLCDRRARTTDDYLAEPSITKDYVPIMRRENLRGLAVVSVQDLAPRRARREPAALLYVSTHCVGAPGDRVVDELHRIAEMAAVGLAHVARGAGRVTDAETGGAGLSARELEVLQLLGDGFSNRDIAARLVVADATVKGHVRAVLRKLDAPSRLAAVAAARRRNLL